MNIWIKRLIVLAGGLLSLALAWWIKQSKLTKWLSYPIFTVFMIIAAGFFFQIPAEDPFDIPSAFAAGGDVIFNDTFTEGTDTAITSHTPDVGTSWVDVYNAGTSRMEVTASSDTVQPDSGGTSDGQIVLASPAPSSADYQVQYTCVDCGFSDEYVMGVIRGTDVFDEANGGYMIWDTTDSTADDSILKLVTGPGSCSNLELINEGNINKAFGTNNVVIVLQAVGSEISVFFNDLAFHYVTNTNITAAGKGGFGFGAGPCNSGGDLSAGVQEIDNFKVIELADNNTGWLNPSTTGETNNDWTNPSNAYADDGSYAEEDDNNGLQDYGDFGFSIPAGSPITGVQVRLVWQSGGGTTYWVQAGAEVSLDNGSTWSTQLDGARVAGSTDVENVFGHANYLWGESWTVTDTADTDFRIRLDHSASESTTGGRDLELDEVAVRIFYDDAPVGGDRRTIIWPQ